MEIETYHTSRLQLRKFTPEVYKHIFSNYSEPEIKAIIGLEGEEQYQTLLKKHEGGMASYNRSLVFFQLVEPISKTVIGGCGLHNWFPDHRRAELGYSIDKEEFKKQGFMKEAVAFVLNYGFTQMNLHRIEALVSPNNIPSLKLVRHFGFQEEGRMHEHYFVNGKFDDSLVFGLLRQN
ncbi:GNAT family N-acetyltransferase [Adhaeribacter sp. BT258]|uniref:GNAT family N-acetyltransferase n=1 Tax=Adhaeribacter terrigena TaxID=2793070 RepID=A0ABS1C475_9BACT|nr:GNAT family protein [Adhaeribacter terrigena]MBK0404160.1 GNAT family N-acetyltransferase [Adhaeribacter terrigena]